MAAAAQHTAEQLFLLDTRGWCVVEDALAPAEVWTVGGDHRGQICCDPSALAGCRLNC